MSETGRATAPSSRCERYRRDGTPCTEPTRHEDRWCRTAECPGYTRARPEAAPQVAGPGRGSRARLRATGDVPVDLDSDEAYSVRLSQRAVDSFRFHHGGSERAARAQLHAMLEDFLLTSARRVNGSGTLSLARSGYVLTLAPALDVVVGYGTQHRERTWEQVRSGVRSRFGKRSPAPRAVPQGPSIELAALPTALDPLTCVLTARARTNFDRLVEDGLVEAGPDEAAREAALREELRRARDTGTCTQRADGVVEIAHLGRRWVVSPNALGLLGIGVLAPPEPPAS